MADPINYNIQQPDIGASLMGGIQQGQALQQNRQQLEAQQAAQARAAQYKTDLQQYLQSPNAAGASAMIAKYPESQKAIAASFDIYSKDQKDEIFKAGTQAYSAIQNGQPEVAKKILDRRIEAARNSGQDVTDLESLKASLDANPQAAAAGLALTMSSLNPESWTKIAREQRSAALAPSELSASQAKAQKLAVDSKFAESKAVQDLQKGGWEIQKLSNDINISRQNAQIAALNAQTARETNVLKKRELEEKLQDKQLSRDQAVQAKASEVTTARASMDNFLNTADRFLNTDIDVIKSAAGPVSSRLPTLSADTADLEELLTTLSSQAFMSQVPNMKGLGALSDAEGAKLSTSLQNLSLRQSPERLMENVREAQRLILKGRANLATKYGVPDITPDTPDAQPSPEDIDALVSKYAGGQ